MDIKPVAKSIAVAELGGPHLPSPTAVGEGLLAPSAGRGLESFGDALFDAVRALNQAQTEADARAVGVATGEPVELHDVMLAQERAALGLELAVQVRNKLVEAYQEVMRMQL